MCDITKKKLKKKLFSNYFINLINNSANVSKIILTSVV